MLGKKEDILKVDKNYSINKIIWEYIFRISIGIQPLRVPPWLFLKWQKEKWFEIVEEK